MNDTVRLPRRVGPAVSIARRVVGVAGLAVVGIAAVLFVLGSWNPWRLVVLEYSWFGNPMLGLLVVPVAALVSLWLALPVRNEVRQRGRARARWVAAGFAVLGLFAWGVLGDHFSFDAQEEARSANGTRAVALVRDRDTPPTTYVRVWAGSGLTTREVGDLGRVCGPVSVEFVGEHRIALDTNYGLWHVDLDPETGAPRQVLGERCPDGPVPAPGG